MGEPIVQVARHRIPDGAEMLGIAAAEILRGADVLWRLEFGEEIIVLRSIERTLTVDRALADHSRFVDVVVLEGVVQDAVRKDVAVVMAVGAARAARRNLITEEFLAARDLDSLGLCWFLA